VRWRRFHLSQFWLAACLGVVLAFCVGRALGVRRAHVLASLRRAAIPDPERVAAGMYRSLGTGVFELLGMVCSPKQEHPVLGLEAAIAEVQTAIAEVQVAKVRGRGVVVATAHTGNWDLVACAVAQHVPQTVFNNRLSSA